MHQLVTLLSTDYTDLHKKIVCVNLCNLWTNSFHIQNHYMFFIFRA